MLKVWRKNCKSGRMGRVAVNIPPVIAGVLVRGVQILRSLEDCSTPEGTLVGQVSVIRSGVVVGVLAVRVTVTKYRL